MVLRQITTRRRCLEISWRQLRGLRLVPRGTQSCGGVDIGTCLTIMTFTLALSLLTTPHAEGAACGAWVVWLPQPWLHTIAEAQLPLLCCAMTKRLRRVEFGGGSMIPSSKS